MNNIRDAFISTVRVVEGPNDNLINPLTHLIRTSLTDSGE